MAGFLSRLRARKKAPIRADSVPDTQKKPKLPAPPLEDVLPPWMVPNSGNEEQDADRPVAEIPSSPPPGCEIVWIPGEKKEEEDKPKEERGVAIIDFSVKGQKRR